ncbi:MAG TPA: hypothetical protein VMU39_04705 [Solirubrobacteraceae bacterium]|nr:hypothetical protein [Solirubrobacteraceae bacterium]
MASADEQTPAAPEPSLDQPRGRIRAMFAASRGLVRIVYRDPEHVAERITIYAIDRLADPSRDWAESVRSERPDTPLAEIVEEQRLQTAQIARIDGAISGTPFFIALIPGYLTYLWQEMRMTLRTAALYGRDLRDLRTAAEMLALRGVHPNPEEAEAALIAVRETPVPDRPPQRRPFRHWVHSVYLLLVFGGFMSPSSAERPQGAIELVRAIASVLLGAALWVMTWVLPVTFMVMMAWGCETHARQLGRRALVFYDGEAASAAAAIAAAARRRDRGHDKRVILRSIAMFLSVLIPIAFVAYANHVRNSVGVNWLGALGALVAVSLVIATVVLASRS